MALEIISAIGREKFKTSIFVDKSLYYINDSPTIAVTPFANINEKIGVNISEIVLSLATNAQKTIATFSNGYTIKVTNRGFDRRENYSYGYVDTYLVTVGLYTANGSEVTTFVNGGCDLIWVKNSVRTVLQMCLYCAIDRETKKGYIVSAREDYNLSGATVYNNIFISGYTQLSSTFYTVLSDAQVFDPDPWSGAGYAGIGGGEGGFDFTSDSVGLPTVPAIDSVSTGFLQLFCGGLPKIIELSKYMWSTDFFDNIVKLTSNPIDIIMGLYMYPFVIPATASKYVRAGNVVTNITMNVPDSQIFEIDCGVFPVPQFYGAYLDFEPFSKCEIYLPYCGTFNLSMDDISGKEINVKYRIDLLTGLCVAYVIVEGVVKYNFTGSCAVNIPISSRSFENLYNSIIGLVGSMFGGGNFSAPSIGSVAGAVSSGKNQIAHGGIASGNAGYLGIQKPYLIFNIPRVAIPKGLNKYTGYPIFATYKLGDLKGYTEIEEIHLENMGAATKDEIDRIVSLLKGGVIL